MTRASAIARAVQQRQTPFTFRELAGRCTYYDATRKVADVAVRTALLPNIRVAGDVTPAAGDAVIVRIGPVGPPLVVAKTGQAADPETLSVSNVPGRQPEHRVAPTYTGTWRRGAWARDVGGPYGNEAQWGTRAGQEWIGAAYYGRALEATRLYADDTWALHIVRLPVEGPVPYQVRLCLLAGQAPTVTGPVVLASKDIGITASPFGSTAELLGFSDLGWGVRFNSGEAGGLGLRLVPGITEGDFNQRVAGSYGLSLTVVGYSQALL